MIFCPVANSGDLAQTQNFTRPCAKVVWTRITIKIPTAPQRKNKFWKVSRRRKMTFDWQFCEGGVTIIPLTRVDSASTQPAPQWFYRAGISSEISFFHITCINTTFKWIYAWRNKVGVPMWQSYCISQNSIGLFFRSLGLKVYFPITKMLVFILNFNHCGSADPLESRFYKKN